MAGYSPFFDNARGGYSSWSDTTLKYGNPAQRAGEQAKKKTAVQHLMTLEGEENEREDRARAGGPFSSGYTGEGDYIRGLNRQGEIADLKSRLGGNGPAKVQHSYAGTEFAEGRGESVPTPNPRRSVNALYDAPSDNLDYFSRLAHVQGQNISNERQRDAEFADSTQDDPAMAGIRRGIHHADIADEGTARGEATANAYLAPGQSVARRQKTWDDEAYNQANGPYSSAAVRGQAEMNKQREISERESQKALIGANARTGSQAIRSYGSIAASEANQGRDVSGARDEVRSRMPGAGGPDDRTITEEEIQAIAQQHGRDPEQVRSFFLQRGYQFGNAPAR